MSHDWEASMIIVYFLIALLGAAVAFFSIQNPQPMAVNVLRWRSVELPLSLLMLSSALAGVLLTALSDFAQQLQLHRRIRRLERQLAKEQRFAEVFKPASPSSVRVEEAPERMQAHMRI
jgi:uncharacterized integral membrane protein